MTTQIDQDKPSTKDGLRLHGPLTLTLHPADEAADEQRAGLATELQKLAESLLAAGDGQVTVQPGDGAGLPARPALSLAGGQSEKPRIHYLALPEDKQSAPFYEALQALSQPAEPGDGLAARLAGLAAPAVLWVFVGPTCPHCPEAVRAANRLALSSPQVSSCIIDVLRYPELAERCSVKAVPLTVLDGELSLTGVVRAGALAEHVLSRGSPEAAEQVLRSLIEQGRTADAVAKVAGGDSAAAFAAIWLRSTTSLRMGLMMVAEEALERRPSCFDEAVEQLLGGVRSRDASLQGDTADLLGQIGHPAAIGDLEQLLAHPNPDVAEIATEALEQIRTRDEPA